MEEQVQVARPHDRAVVNAEVLKSAKRQCTWCYGKGLITQIMNPRGAGPVYKHAAVRVEKLCVCALPRFLKAHGHQLIESEGKMYWAVGMAPELKEDVK